MLTVAENLGLKGISPIVLGDAGNIIVHLAPYPIVARVAKLFDGDDPNFWREIWLHELKVANHLLERGVPVVPCSKLVPPGPHRVADTWMTLWEYAESVSLPTLGAEQAIDMVNDLVSAMLDFNDPLPPLGAWRNVNQAFEHLRSIDNDDRISKLLLAYEQVNERIQTEITYPAHGDAHPGNLLPTSTGWRWIDFEDVSLMPKYWDFASFISNSALFHGLVHHVVQYVLTKTIASTDKQSFQFAMQARVIMSTMTNLSLALQGHGDLEFAHAQLDRINDFLLALKDDSLWN